jgi:hypothetical protein
VHRALGRDLHQLLALLLGQLLRHLHDHVEARGGAALGGFVVHLDRDVVDLPAFALGVHLHRYRGTGGEAGREELLGTRPDVVAAVLGGLVGRQVVLADGHVLRELAAVTASDRPHVRPSKSLGSGSSA